MVDNIMLDADGKPVNVPGNDTQNIVVDANGLPVVPAGTQKPLGALPQDTLPRLAPQQQMPAYQEPVQRQVTNDSNATENVITFEQLAAKKGFKSADDLAKAYSNLESQNKRVEATLTDAINARLDGQKPIAPEVIENLDDVDEKDAVKIIASMIDKKVGRVKDAFDYQLHLMQNPQDKEFASEAIRIVRENPGIQWKVAFDAARASNTANLMKQAREDGTKEAYANIGNKQDAQAMPSNQQRTITGDISIKDVIEGVKTGKIRLAEARNIINTLNQDVRQ